MKGWQSELNKGTESHDPVKSPSHYMVAGVEVRDIQRELTFDMRGQQAADFSNAVKYLLRSPRKQKFSEDLKKCQQHISWLIETLEASNATQR